MQPILYILQADNSEFGPYLTDDRRWVFLDNLSQKQPSFFVPLVMNQDLLVVEYAILCDSIRSHVIGNQDSSAELMQQMLLALMLATTLEHLYCYYTPDYREQLRYREEQKWLRNCLATQRILFSPVSTDNARPNGSLPQLIRALTATSNWWRVFTLRLRRLTINLSCLLDELCELKHLILMMEASTDSIVAYMAWIFFAPRLLGNLFLLVKHTCPGWWMTDEESSLGWALRMKTQLRLRWFELSNDIVWFTAGLLNFVVLTGAWASVSIYLAVALQLFDVVLALLRYHFEMSRLCRLQKAYNETFLNHDVGENNSINSGLLEALIRWISLEKQFLALGVAVTTSLFISVTLSLPVMAASPLLPIIGSLLSVCTTIVQFKLNAWIDAQRPTTSISSLPNGILMFNHPAVATPVQPSDCLQDVDIDCQNNCSA
ncbi:MAG: hypothetical protein ACOVQX_05975 [Legionella sp.]